MESICVEFLTVLERLQAKDCYLVVSSQQAMVLQQISVLKGHLKNVVSRQRVSRHLMNIREVLEKVVQDCAPTKYKTFWAKFHVASTTELPTLWEKVRASIETPIDPLTYQAVSRQWVEMLLSRITRSTHDSGEISERIFTPEEEKAIMYASGFVVRRLQRKYVKIDTPSAAEVTETLINLLSGGKYEDDDSRFEDFLEEWFQDVDRGGLSLVNPSAFTLFKCIESVTYMHLQPILEGDQPKDNTVIAAAVCSNEHLQFLWATISLDITTERDSQALLKEMVDLWIKMRGHAITSMIVELYKRQKAKNTKGAKGIRKQLKLSESYYCSSSCTYYKLFLCLLCRLRLSGTVAIVLSESCSCVLIRFPSNDNATINLRLLQLSRY